MTMLVSECVCLALPWLFCVLPNGAGFFRAFQLSTLRPAFAKPTAYRPHLFYLFVYGKLKKAEENHYWLTNPENGLCKFIGLGQTVKKYPLLVGKYKTPILLDNPGEGHRIFGEIYVVDTFMLKNLDMLEGLPVFNSRKLEIMRIFSEDKPDGKEMFCWMYYSRVKSVNLAGRDLISEYSSKTCSDDYN